MLLHSSSDSHSHRVVTHMQMWLLTSKSEIELTWTVKVDIISKEHEDFGGEYGRKFWLEIIILNPQRTTSMYVEDFLDQWWSIEYSVQG